MFSIYLYNNLKHQIIQTDKIYLLIQCTMNSRILILQKFRIHIYQL